MIKRIERRDGCPAEYSNCQAIGFIKEPTRDEYIETIVEEMKQQWREMLYAMIELGYEPYVVCRSELCTENPYKLPEHFHLHLKTWKDGKTTVGVTCAIIATYPKEGADV